MKKIADLCKTAFYRIKYKNVFINGRMPEINKEVYLKLSNTARIELNGVLTLDGNSRGHNGRSSILRMDMDSALRTHGDFCFMYGADIQLFKCASLELGHNSFINSDCKIRCHKMIHIGNDCAISHDVTIMDSDAHMLNGDRHTNPVIIGNHVWIGTRVIILNGVHVGDGAVIAAGSLVNTDVPARALAAGCPARVIKENIDWSM